MSGTQPLPRFHIDQPESIPNGVRADLGRVFDRRTRKVGTAGWDGQYRLVVFTPDQLQPHLSFMGYLSTFSPAIAEPVTLDVGLGRFIALDDPRLYPLIGTAIQGDKLDAIKRARVVFDLGLAEAKSLIEAVLVERSERGPITGVTLKDGRTVVVRQQDDDEAKERERRSIEALRATDELRAKDMNEAMADVFRGANLRPGNTLHVVTGSTDKPKSQIIGADDFRDAVIDWSLNPTAEKYETLRQAEAACGLSPDEQIKAANERAHAAEESAKRLQAVIDAETGRKGLEGWVYSYVFRDMVDNAAWRLDLSDGRCVVAWGRRMDGSDKYEESNPGGWAIWMLNADGELDEEYGVGGNDPVWNALDAMEHATRRLHELGLLAQATPSP